MAEMSPLRRRMIEDMTIRNPSPALALPFELTETIFALFLGSKSFQKCPLRHFTLVDSDPLRNPRRGPYWTYP